MNEPTFLQPNHYEPKSKNIDTPRGIRNCNPLNIRINAHNNWIGKYPKEANNDGSFEQFQFMYQGFLAALKLIGNTYILKYKLNTLSAIINRWAPEEDGNDPVGYLAKVCAWTGVGGKEPISNHDPRLKNIVMAMAVVECGPEIKHYNAALNEAFEQYKPKFPKMGEHYKKYYDSRT